MPNYDDPGDPFATPQPPLPLPGDSPMLPPEAYAADPWGWVPDHWVTPPTPQVDAGAPPDMGAPLPVDALGPPGPPAETPSPIVDNPFAAGPALEPVHPADAAGAGLQPLPDGPPPMPFGAAPAPGVGPPPAAPVDGPHAAPFGPQLPQQPIQTPYGWDPLAGSLYETPHIQPDAPDPFAGVSEPTGYADAAHLAIEDPAAFAQLQVDEIKRKQIADSAGRIKAEQDNLDALKADQAARQKADAETQIKADKITADAIELSKRPLDRGRWFGNLSTFGKITAAITATLLGANSGRGPNQGVDYISRHIDEDIADQKYALEAERGALQTRQGAVAQEFARTGNLFQAAEVVRQATYQATVNRLLTEQQNFDPQGTAYINYGKAIQGLQAQAAQSRESTRKTIWDETYKTEQLRNELQKTADARWKDRQQISLEWAKQNEAKAGKESFTPLQLSALNPGMPVPPIPMSLPEYDKWLGAQKTGQEYQAAARENSPEDRARRLSVGEIVDDKGKPIEFRDVAAATKIADSKAAVDSGVHLIDKLVTARNKYGWTSDLVQSKEWRQMQADYAALQLQKKNSDQLGVLSASDLEIVGRSLGTTDPTEMRDPTPGLLTARSNMVESLQSTVRSQAVLPPGRNVARWEPPPPPKPHVETPDEHSAKSVLQDPFRDWEPDRLTADLGINPRGMTASQLGQFTANRLRELDGVLPSARATLDGWAADLQGPDTAKRDRAAAALGNAANTAQLPGVRQYASQLLVENVGRAAPEPVSTLGPEPEPMGAP